ncbi:hypothetical protein [Streptomyces sp. 378]|uniref:hypothetical protein n=1 Tax=Streptomyces sp. 378 TaxID=3049412 RepID=UPI0032E35DFD
MEILGRVCGGRVRGDLCGDVLQQLVAAPRAVLEQVVYLSASALAGVARFTVLRLVVFARNRSQFAPTVRTVRPMPATVARAAASAGPAVLCYAA